ncbi:phenylacetate--CoA ligase family protein [Candidatus Hydrogenedentota bacterium]
MNKFIADKIAFPLYQKLKGRTVAGCLRELERISTSSASEIREYQARKLRKLVEYCSVHVPFYRQHWHESGVNPSDIREVSDLPKLPCATKEMLRSEGDLFCTVETDRAWEPARTSGSTGIPLELKIDLRAADAHYAAKIMCRKWWGIEPGDRNVFVGGAWERLSRKHTLRSMLTENQFFLTALRLDDAGMEAFWRALLQFRTTYFYSWTSHAAPLARFLKRNSIDGLEAGLRGIVLTAEMLTSSTREFIENVFGCPVINEYGAAEAMAIAYECPEGSLHVLSPNVIIEAVQNGIPVDPGEKGEVLLTELNNYVQPLVRYHLKDQVVLSDKKCGCGRSLPIIEEVVGRESDKSRVILPNGDIMHSAIFEYLVFSFSSADGRRAYESRVIHKEVDLFIYQLAVDEDLRTGIEAWLKRGTEEQLGFLPRLEFQYFEYVPRGPSGKLLPFVSELSSDDGRE